MRSGSKRFKSDDLEAVFEVKFVKNKCFFPLNKGSSITGDELEEMDSASLREVLNPRANKLADDLEQLASLPDHIDRFFILFSNNNYLFAGELAEAEKAETIKHRVGNAAQSWIADSARQTHAWYAYPGNVLELGSS